MFAPVSIHPPPLSPFPACLSDVGAVLDEIVSGSGAALALEDASKYISSPSPSLGMGEKAGERLSFWEVQVRDYAASPVCTAPPFLA